MWTTAYFLAPWVPLASAGTQPDRTRGESSLPDWHQLGHVRAVDSRALNLETSWRVCLRGVGHLFVSSVQWLLTLLTELNKIASGLPQKTGASKKFKQRAAVKDSTLYSIAVVGVCQNRDKHNKRDDE